MPNVKQLSTLALLFALLCGPLTLQAEKLSIINQPANSPAGVLRPTAGMTMQQVEASFGAPNTTMPYVGEPPITRWVYGSFTVYFEHEYVIHAVVHHK